MRDRFGNRSGGRGGYGNGGGGGGYQDRRDVLQQRPPFQGAGQHQRLPYQGDFHGQGNQSYSNRGRYGNNFYQRNPQYARKEVGKVEGPNSSGATSVGQNQMNSAVEKQSTSTTQVTSSEATNNLPPKGGPVSSGQKSDGANSGMVKQADSAKVVCNKCGLKGHWPKDCKEDMVCVNCGKGHISDNCVWLKQRKHVASLVGFGAPGLACFISDHAKDGTVGEKGKAIAIVRVQQGSYTEVDAAMLEECLGKTYPWKWDWQAKELAVGVFLVNFPSIGRISEVAVYDWVTLRGEKIKINVKQWTDETMAAGKLDTVWVQAKRVPKSLKNYHGLCEVGSTLGQVLEIDMKTLRETGEIKMLIGVVDHKKIPTMTKLTTKKLMIYYIYFRIVKVVEEGWLRPEDEYIQNFDDMEDSLSQDEFRDSKRQKNETEKIVMKGVQASAQTIKALEEREAIQKKQAEIDAGNLVATNNKSKNGVSENSQAVNANKAAAIEMLGPNKQIKEGGGDTDKHEDLLSDQCAEGVEKVDYSGTDHGAGTNSDSSTSFNTKLKNVMEGKPNKQSGLTCLDEEDDSQPRFSDRLATKEDIPILDRAKNLTRSKNLQAGGGETGKKGQSHVQR